MSPGCTLTAILFPSLSKAPGPTASTFASLSSLTADSGRKMPPAVFASALTRWTRMRSRRGARDLIDLTVRDWMFVSDACRFWWYDGCFGELTIMNLGCEERQGDRGGDEMAVDCL